MSIAEAANWSAVPPCTKEALGGSSGMAEAARPGATVSAPCDLAQLTTPTYARGRLAKLRREAGRKGSGRCEMARVCCAFMSSTSAAAAAQPSRPHAWPRLGSSFQLVCRFGLLSAQTRGILRQARPARTAS